MPMDYLSRESDEVKVALLQIERAERTMQAVAEHYQPSIRQEHYLTGEELCEYLHISVRTLQTLRDTRQIPFTVVGERTIIYPEAGIREVLLKNYRPTEDPF